MPMDFKFKDEDKKTKDEAVENETPEGDAFEGKTVEHEGEKSEAAGGATLEPYTGESDAVENDVMASESTEGDEAVGAAMGGEVPDAPPKYRVSLEDEDSERSSFKLPLKQILLVIVLLGGGYYVKTYHAKEGKAIRIEKPPVAEIQKPTPEVSSLEGITGLLDESRELFESIKEQKNRRKNQASARRSSGNASPRRINLQELKNYKGQWVTILMKDGLQREGRIVDVKEKIVHLEQDYDYGTISVRVPIQNIADVHE